jgi:hypothetical protein
MSGLGAMSTRHLGRIASDDAELDWLRERGVEIDHKGRIIVRLPEPDLDLEFRDEEQSSIADLMRRSVNRRNGSARGRRRASHNSGHHSVGNVPKRRRGRPTIGDETRVRVQTTIDPRTRDALRRCRQTLADVFDGCARELTNGL